MESALRRRDGLMAWETRAGAGFSVRKDRATMFVSLKNIDFNQTTDEKISSGHGQDRIEAPLKCDPRSV